MTRAAESESRPESVGVNRFGRSRSRSMSRQNFADSDSGSESRANTRQQTMILDEQLCILLIMAGKTGNGIVQIKLKRHLLIGFCLVNDIGDNFKAISIVV